MNKQLKKLNDPDWKIQKEALEEIDKILTLNPRISLENLSDFSNCLKNGLKDKKNKCLLRVYINLTSKFCESSGREFFNFGKILIQHLLSSLSDKQALVRCDIVNALHKFENNLGSEFILNHISIFLMNNENKESQSVEMKQEILNWLLKNANLLVKFPNLKSLLPIFLNMLAEKNKEIRILTDQLVEKIILAIGPNLFAESLKNMKPSLIQQIKPLFEKYNVSYKASLTVFPEKEIKANEIDLEKTKVNEPHHLLLENKLEETRPARNISKNKKIRLEQDNITPWPINEINDDLIDELKENLSGYYSESNIRKMFSFDVKKNIEIIMFLKENVHTKEILSNSDLIFKWLLFKLMNHVNKEFIEEILELIISVLQNMIQSQSPLFESEIRIILSCLKKVKENNSFDLTEKITKIDQILHGLFNNDYIANFWGKTKNTKTFNINSNNEAGTFSTLPQPKENYDFDKPATSKRNSLPGGGANNNSLDYINMNNYSESPSPNQPRNLTKKMILQNNLEVLNWSSIPGKIDALLNIYNFLSEETPENKIIIQSEATNIAKVIGFLFQPEVEMDNKLNSNTPYQFVNYLVKISMKIFSSKFLLDNVSYDVLSELIEKILQRLLIEDANKGDKNNSSYSENNDDIPIKNLNSLMLKILETCSPNNIFQILFDLLIKYRKFCIFSKFIALVIKCILKLTKVMETLLSNLDVGLIFLKFHLYICEFYNENLKNNEDLGVKTIKTIINEIIKIKGASVLDYYHIIANHDKNDKYIFRYFFLIITILLFEFIKMD